ncbi:hypothetical protein [Cyanobacterium sp. Dongsha4]|uniref:hypothetical protein n=1 Tax=Cyanobacterium sp. DS4 TaxID=2878255 RepID=UPI002E81D6B5|nr:hypothetical protein [Cyanobacterium sp. Dongsha4]WVL00570.1 hypothetical protein Dongsha4_18315 [Cyanobacterium sp. Dongsha4]
MFDNGDYQSIDLNDWIMSNPNSALGNTFQLSPEMLEKLPVNDQLFLYPSKS